MTKPATPWRERERERERERGERERECISINEITLSITKEECNLFNK